MSKAIIKSPIAWMGLPDLRDLSYQSTMWRRLPVSIPVAAKSMRVSRQSVYLFIRSRELEWITLYDKTYVIIESLPQTSRCQIIESMFRPGQQVENLLFMPCEVKDILGMTAYTLEQHVETGEIIKEILPNKRTIRYPIWGMPKNYQVKLRAGYRNLSAID